MKSLLKSYIAIWSICLSCPGLIAQVQKSNSIDQDSIQDATAMMNDMMFVKGDDFTFGGGIWPSSHPESQVRLHDFYIDKYEVTKGEYNKFCDETGNPRPVLPKGRTGECDVCPVEGVNWGEAQKFCNHLGKRLPTEAEWEFAALGGIYRQGNIYSGSNNYEDVAWFGENSGSIYTGLRNNPIGGTVDLSRYIASVKTAATIPVGMLAPNELGIYDMNGNVWEWCEDWFGGYNREDKDNPHGPVAGSKKVIRGGCVINAALNQSVKERLDCSPDQAYRGKNIIGFRCVKE
ncbi:MAG: SUMF1/EgtB/PvdO family nonheme iron enzyme [Bacteroidales bacterium]|nr:SUMF1/EgtB/PvdO family nonheme iron enzyme [Bacteroidales bacterium]